MHTSTPLHSTLERDGFHLGWDLFCYGMAMPPEPPIDLVLGYEAAAEKRAPVKEHDRYVRKWLQLRLGALQRERAVNDNVTPEYLKKIEDTHCPVSLVRLTYATGADTDWSIDRVNNNGAYARGNLVMVSSRVNRAKRALNFEQVHARGKGEVEDNALTKAEWERLAVIMLGAYQYAEEAHKRPNKVLPCCAWLPPGVPRSFSMDLQNHLLYALDSAIRMPESERWLRETKKLLKGRSQVAFKELTTRIERRTNKVLFPPDTWRNPGVWKAYCAFLDALLEEDRLIFFETFKRYAKLTGDGPTGSLAEWSRDTKGYVPLSRSQRAELEARTLAVAQAKELEASKAQTGEAGLSCELVAQEPSALEDYESAARALAYEASQTNGRRAAMQDAARSGAHEGSLQNSRDDSLALADAA